MYLLPVKTEIYLLPVETEMDFSDKHEVPELTD